MPAVSDKKILRAEMRARRADLAKSMPGHAERLGGHAAALELEKGAVVAGYMALAGEADPSILMAHLEARGARLVLPRVTGRNEALSFHRYDAGTRLVPGAYGIAEPPASSPPALPGIVLVPLLAFDPQGRRLGYGGGYYDRTLAALRAKHRIAAIGVAFAGQEIGHLPTEAFDQPLDAVLTEDGLRRFGR